MDMGPSEILSRESQGQVIGFDRPSFWKVIGLFTEEGCPFMVRKLYRKF